MHIPYSFHDKALIRVPLTQMNKIKILYNNCYSVTLIST